MSLIIGQQTVAEPALSYIERGWAVFPLHTPNDRGGCSCGWRRRAPDEKHAVGKHPRNEHGWHEASTDPAVVTAWFEQWPDANIGIACARSGLVVIDIDPRRGADEDLHEMEQELGELPATVRSETGGGGCHLLFEHPGVPLVGKVGEVDIQSNAYIVAPPSLHWSGRRYEWDIAPDDVPVAQLSPPWIAALMKQPLTPPKVTGISTGTQGVLAGMISAQEYVPLLCGQYPGPDCKMRCPFADHEDRTPSFHCYAELGRDWCCYGCKRAGSIYDFYAHYVGIHEPLRREVFLEVEERLFAHLGVS